MEKVYDKELYFLQDVIEKVHHLLLYLNTLCNNTHPCLLQFLNKKFKDSQRVSIQCLNIFKF